jgi:DNA polymerase-3 subunit beta
MNLTLTKQELLHPLKMVASVVEERKVLPILSTILLQTDGDLLKLTGGDGEIEISCQLPIESGADFAVTVPKKLLDITRSLPDGSELNLTDTSGNGKLIVHSGKSRFTLSTLAANDYPASPELETTQEFTTPQARLKYLLKQCVFCSATNDVRYYLNGLLLEINDDEIHLVATDGHRMATTQVASEGEGLELVNDTETSVIIPRKTVLELLKLLGDDSDVQISFNDTHIRFTMNESLQLTSKLIDGKFPDWRAVIPQQAHNVVTLDKTNLQAALTRVALLSNEKYKGVRLTLTENLLTINAKNPNQEEATEELEVDYTGEPLEIGFNCVYLLEALAVIGTSDVRLAFTDSNSSVLITQTGDETGQWIIMPMRL